MLMGESPDRLADWADGASSTINSTDHRTDRASATQDTG